MREQHGLGVLQVGPAGQNRVRMPLRLRHQRFDDVERACDDPLRRVAQPHPEEGGDLVVAGAAGAKLAAEFGARAFEKAAFEGGVDVLVGDRGGERA